MSLVEIWLKLGKFKILINSVIWNETFGSLISGFLYKWDHFEVIFFWMILFAKLKLRDEILFSEEKKKNCKKIMPIFFLVIPTLTPLIFFSKTNFRVFKIKLQ